MTKSALRKKYKVLRTTLAPEAVENLSIKITKQVCTLPIWDKTYYHLFLTIKKQHEVDTHFIRDFLQEKNKKIVVSKSNFASNTLNHYLLTQQTLLKENTYGIPEPVHAKRVPVSKIDVVFVPLLAFDTTGNRIGYGKGFYDGFLKQCRADTLKIGLSFFPPEGQIYDVSPHDIPLDYAITPEKRYVFSF